MCYQLLLFGMKRAAAPILVLTALLVLLSMRVVVREAQPSGPEIYTLSGGREYFLFSHTPSGRGRPAGGHEIAERWAYGYPYRVLTVDTTRYGDWYAKGSFFWLAGNVAWAGLIAIFLVAPVVAVWQWVGRKGVSFNVSKETMG